jgi:hypothetical protein
LGQEPAAQGGSVELRRRDPVPKPPVPRGQHVSIVSATSVETLARLGWAHEATFNWLDVTLAA